MTDGTPADESHHEPMLAAIEKRASEIGSTFDREQAIALFRALDKNEAELEEVSFSEDLVSIRRQHELGIKAVDLLAELSKLVGFDVFEFLRTQ